MAKQWVKTYENILGDYRRKITEKTIEVQINEDLQKNPTWTIHSLTYFKEGKSCTVIFNTEVDYVIKQAPQGIEAPGISYPDIFNTPKKNPCEGCDFYKRLQQMKPGEYYIGDSPCQWCQHYPYRITCSENGVQ